MSFGWSPVLSLKILQVVIGGFTLAGWRRLSEKAGLKGWFLSLLCIAAVPFTISYALLHPTADLLFLTILLFLLTELSAGSWQQPSGRILVSGVLGAFLYFSKAFGMPLFIVLFVAVTVLRLSGKYEKDVVYNSLRCFLVFILLCGGWVLALSLKYHEFTISKAAAFNMTREVAPQPGQVIQLPVLTDGLYPPPDEHSASAWESPGEVKRLTPLHPFSSREDMHYYLRVVQRNLLTIYYYDFKRQAGILFLVLLVVFVLTNGLQTFFKNKIVLLLLLCSLFIYGGYSLVLVHTRYVWACTWFLLLVSGWMLQEMGTNRWRRISTFVWLIITLLVAIKRPVKEILFTEDKEMPAIWIARGVLHPFETLQSVYREDRAVHLLSQKLKAENLLSGRIASLRDDSESRHYYSSTLFVTSSLGLPYYGQLDRNLSFEEQIKTLREAGISYLFVWSGETWRREGDSGVQEYLHDADTGLTIYALN